MSERSTTTKSGGDPSLDEIREKLEKMESFFSRRFDEVSAEVNAASQLVGMAEDSVKQRFGEIIEVLEAISHHGDGQSRAQAGVELDAVLKITEDAANRILDAADRISERLDDESLWSDPAQRGEAIAETKNDVQEILMASAFQDLTGQRIQSTIDNLQQIEQRLSQTLEKFGIETDSLRVNITQHVEAGSSQDQVDEMFDNGQGAAGTVNGRAS